MIKIVTYNIQFGRGRDSATLHVYQQVVEEDSKKMELEAVGQPGRLEVTVRLFPAPANDDAVWIVEQGGGGEPLRLHPGQSLQSFDAPVFEVSELAAAMIGRS